MFLYEKLKTTTRFKVLLDEQHSLNIGPRSYSYCARKYFNLLPNYLKTPNESEHFKIRNCSLSKNESISLLLFFVILLRTNLCNVLCTYVCMRFNRSSIYVMKKL